MSVALGSVSAALIAFLGSLWVWWVSARRTAKAAELDRRQKAYVDLLVASQGISLRVHALITMLKTRSGLSEGIAVTFGQRKELDALEVYDWINQDFGALMDAWSRAWAYGTLDGVDLSNSLLDACSHVIEVTTMAAAHGLRQKVRQMVIGVDTDRLTSEWNERLKLVAVARRDLANHMRTETKRPMAELFPANDRAQL